MLGFVLKKYKIFIIIFILFQAILYKYRFNSSNPIPYLNILFYFISFLLIHASLDKTEFNKYLIKLFYFFYGFLSIVISISILTKSIDQVNLLVYIYVEIIINLIILTISIYLVLYSLRLANFKEMLIFYLSISISFILAIVSYYTILINPYIISSAEGWNIWLSRNNGLIVFSIFLLLIFWYCYYIKLIIIGEYLNYIIFLFTLTNMFEALNYIAFQWELKIWFKIQLFLSFMNILMIGLWYGRLVYLNSDIAKENERYLMNFQYLNGIVSKPRKTWFSQLFSKFPLYSTLVIIGGLTIGLVVLYLIKKISFYLLLNTIFILLIILLALFFSFSSIKRDWHDQFDMFLKKNKR